MKKQRLYSAPMTRVWTIAWEKRHCYVCSQHSKERTSVRKARDECTQWRNERKDSIMSSDCVCVRGMEVFKANELAKKCIRISLNESQSKYCSSPVNKTQSKYNFRSQTWKFLSFVTQNCVHSKMHTSCEWEGKNSQEGTYRVVCSRLSTNAWDVNVWKAMRKEECVCVAYVRTQKGFTHQTCTHKEHAKVKASSYSSERRHVCVWVLSVKQTKNIMRDTWECRDTDKHIVAWESKCLLSVCERERVHSTLRDTHISLCSESVRRVARDKLWVVLHGFLTCV